MSIIATAPACARRAWTALRASPKARVVSTLFVAAAIVMRALLAQARAFEAAAALRRCRTELAAASVELVAERERAARLAQAANDARFEAGVARRELADARRQGARTHDELALLADALLDAERTRAACAEELERQRRAPPDAACPNTMGDPFKALARFAAPEGEGAAAGAANADADRRAVLQALEALRIKVMVDVLKRPAYEALRVPASASASRAAWSKAIRDASARVHPDKAAAEWVRPACTMANALVNAMRTPQKP